MRHHDVDGIVGEPGGEQPHHLGDAAAVVHGVLGGVVQKYLRGPHGIPVRKEGQRRDVGALPVTGTQHQHAARCRPFRRAEQVHPELAEHGPVYRVEQMLIVVVPCDHDHVAAILPEPQQGVHHQSLRRRAGRGRLEQVPRDEHDVDVGVPGHPHDAGEDCLVLLLP